MTIACLPPPFQIGHSDYRLVNPFFSEKTGLLGMDIPSNNRVCAVTACCFQHSQEITYADPAMNRVAGGQDESPARRRDMDHTPCLGGYLLRRTCAQGVAAVNVAQQGEAAHRAVA